MKCTILHESRGRMRVHVHAVRMTLHRADVLEAYLNHQDSIHHATVYERTGDVVLTYTGSRKEAIALLAGYKFDNAELDVLVTSNDSRKINREYQDKMFTLVAAGCSCPLPSRRPTPSGAPSRSSGKASAACCSASWRWKCWMH